MSSIITRFTPGNKLIASALVMSALMLTGCGQEQQQRTMPPPGVSFINVFEQEVGDYQEFVARTEAVNQVQLRARVEGFINKRAFIEGEQVKKGELLFEIDRKPYIASLKKAEADLASSKAELVKATKDLQRSKDLFKKGYISQADLDTQTSAKDKASAAVQAANAAVETARLNLGYTRISAPFSGKVGKERYSVGSLVGPTSEPLATLTSVDPIYVNFQVNEKQLLTYEQNARKNGGDRRGSEYELSLKLPTGSEYDHKGSFNFSDTSIDETTGTLSLRASFPNPDEMLYPGLYVTLVAESADKHLLPLVPQSAVQENQSGSFVMVVNNQNIAEIRQVTMGRRIGPMWVVTKGLKPGEKLIVDGLQKVRANAPVNPKMVTINSETGTIQPSPQPEEA